MKTARINESNFFAVLTVGSFLLLLLVAGCGFIFGSAKFGLSILAGGLLAIGNFYWLKSILIRAFTLSSREAPRFTGLRYIVRLTVMAIAIFLLIVHGKADVFGLLLGLSVLVINIIALAFFMISAKGE